VRSRRAREHIEHGAVTEGYRAYSEMIRYLDDDDPTTRRMIEEILADEEDHADDLRTLLETRGQDEPEKAERGS